MARNVDKKSVRFLSPFETDEGSNVPVIKKPNGSKIKNATAAEKRPKSNFHSAEDKIARGNPSVSGDSWDAFDAKMMKTPLAPTDEIKDQFLELSINQSQSSNMDVVSMSFQDPKSLIDKDENERLLFMNSNLSFDGISQMEAPSLLSFTTYFQQGSSFPVPYVGNDSTMMFGNSTNPVPASGPSSSFLDSQLASETLRRFSSGTQTHSIRGSSITRRVSTGDSIQRTSLLSVTEDGRTGVERKDSLTKFFLGPETRGLGKMDIMEYVLDYCKRRASFRDLDTSSSDIPPPPHRIVTSANTHPESIATTHSASEDHPAGRKQTGTESLTTLPIQEGWKGGITNTNFNQNQHHDPEASVVLSDGASLKDREDALLDISDVGSSSGFEKFKKHLVSRRSGEDRYRDKAKNHVDFEKKRLQVDEKYSHPRLSPTSVGCPGATTTLERPRKRLICNSPPERLVTSKPHRENNENHASPRKLLTPSPRNEEGQCQSTPVNAEGNKSRTGILQKDLKREDVGLLKFAEGLRKSKEERQKQHKLKPKVDHGSLNSRGTREESDRRGKLITKIDLYKTTKNDKMLKKYV